FCSPTITGPKASWSLTYKGKSVRFRGNKWILGVGTSVSCSSARALAPGLLKKWTKTPLGGSFKSGKYTCSKTRVRSYDGKGFSPRGFGCASTDANHYFSLTMIAPHTPAELGGLVGTH